MCMYVEYYVITGIIEASERDAERVRNEPNNILVKQLSKNVRAIMATIHMLFEPIHAIGQDSGNNGEPCHTAERRDHK